MEEELEFQERQRFKYWWIILLIMFPIIVMFISITIYQLSTGKPFGDKPMSDTMAIVTPILFVLFTAILTVIFYFMRLDTVINEEGVYERLFPNQLKFGFTPWDNISDACVIKMNPMLKFSALGNNNGLIGGKTYYLLGNKVLRLTLNNNKKIYIGTEQPEELTEFLEKLDARRKQK